MNQLTYMDMVFNYTSVEVQHEPEKNVVQISFKKPSKSEDFRSAYNKALDLATENHCKRWLIDQREQSIHPSDQEWSVQEWFPRSIQQFPLDPDLPRYVAVVQSRNFFVEFSAKKFIEENSVPGLVVEVFRDPDSAMNWVARQGR